MDINYLLFLQKIREALGGVLDGTFLKITLLGETTTFILVTTLIYWCYKKKLGIYMMFNFCIAAAINFILKFTFCVDRPWIRDSRVKPVSDAIPKATGYSFPSGHTANATSFFGSLAVYFKKNRLVKVICIILILLVGFSRNYLGVHTPQDVLVSLVIGCVLLYVVKNFLEYIEKNPSKDLIVLGVGIVVGVGFVYYASTINIIDENSSDVALYFSQIGGSIPGLIIGWILEKRFLNFNNEASIVGQVVKYIVGVAGFMGLNALIGITLSEALGMVLCTFINNFLCFIYIVYLYPLIFTKVSEVISLKKNKPNEIHKTL